MFKNLLLSTLFLSASLSSFAQYQFSLQAGMGACFVQPKNVTTSDAKFTMSATALKKFGKRFYIGGSLAFDQFSFMGRTTGAIIGQHTSSVVETHNNSSYLNLLPTADIGLGKRQWLHFFVMAGGGVLLHGTERTQSDAYYTPYGDTSFNSSSNISKTMLQFGFGAKAFINLNKQYSIVLCSTYGATPTIVSTCGGNPIRPDYITLQLGLMRRYGK